MSQVMILVRRRAEHDQFPLVADFVEPEDVHAIVIRSDFDVPIAGSVPLIHDFYDVDPTLTPIKPSGRRPEIRMRLDLNAHQLIHGIRGRDSVLILSMPDVVHFVRPASPQMSLRVLQVSQTTFGDQDDEGASQFMGHTIGAGTCLKYKW